MWTPLATLVSWVFRGAVIKFVILTGVFAVMAIVIPAAINLVVPHIGTGSLTSAFSGVAPGIWWFLDMFRLDVGLPLLISGLVARFLIRRLPIIG